MAKWNVTESETIRQLRARVTELETALTRREAMHECAMAERDDATLYADEQKARAEAAEADRRMIVTHATMGSTDGQGMGLNEICVKITAIRNEVYREGKSRAEAAEALLARAYEAARDDAALAAENTGTCLMPNGQFLSERCRDNIRALPVPSPADLAARLRAGK